MNMRKSGQLVVALLVALAAAFGGTVRSASAVTTGEDLCEGEGGEWVGDGGDPDTGFCSFDPYTAPSIEECNDLGLNTVYVFVAGTPVDYFCATGDDLDYVIPGSIGWECVLVGGIWRGDEGFNGTCTFPAGHEFALGYCGPGYHLVYILVDDDFTGEPECVLPASGPEPPRVPGFGQFGSTTSHNDGGGTLAMSGGKNGSVTFDPGTCAGKCTVGPNLPGGAHADLPDDAVAWLYFKSVDENGDPGTGTYTVCFNVGDLTSPVIYRYVSGAWVVVSSTVSGGQVCTSASGDGAFALGGS